ncbi:MAG: thymidine phosphorylase [Synergistaceae bacterium]|jgi:pyrimidine-nucleoside phosphorylase|nr:thymidine phosphorylase [Synergistaceae bacterium]
MPGVIEFIERKRDGGAHTPAELALFVSQVRDGDVPDYQVSAWLMAVFLNGFTEGELVAFTSALASSGETVRFPKHPSEVSGAFLTVDKHSTGGVGDKTTLVCAPLAAACGLRVAKLSGRGLGFTGGTVDKLESIPGMDVSLSTERFLRQADEIGIALSGHSMALAPAEGKFYALRDVTGTVPSLPLISSSIVSKKIAGGADAFVFDVKCGSGAFMTNMDDAIRLAESLTGLSSALGKKSSFLVTDMEQPLGEWVGNAVEVREAIEVLSGGGPADTREMCLALAARMLLLGGVARDEESSLAAAREALDGGGAVKKFAQMISAQGGDASVCENPDILPRAAKKKVVEAPCRGIVAKADARAAGEALRALGGGRLSKGDGVDLSVGLRILKKIGDSADVREPLMEIHYNDDAAFERAAPYIEGIYSISGPAQGIGPRPLILRKS